MIPCPSPFPNSAALSSPNPGAAESPLAVIAPSASGEPHSCVDRDHRDRDYGATSTRTPGNEATYSRTAERIETDA